MSALVTCPVCDGKPKRDEICKGCGNKARVSPRRAGRLKLRQVAKASGKTLAELRRHEPSGPSEKALERLARKKAVAA